MRVAYHPVGRLKSLKSTAGKRTPSRVIALALTFSIALLASRARSVEIERVAPAYCAAYIVIKDIQKVTDGMKASSSWQAFLSHDNPRIKRAKEFIELLNTAGTLSNQVALVQTYTSVEAFNIPSIIADLKEIPEEIQKTEQLLRTGGNEIYPNAGAYKDVQFGLVGQSSRYAFLDNIFVLTPGQDAFEAIVDAYRGEEPSLAHDPKFNFMVNNLSFKGEILAYINLEVPSPVTYALKQNLNLQLLGMHEAESILWTANLLASTRDQEVCIQILNREGILESLFARPKPLLSPHLIPASGVDIFCATHVGDPILVWERIMSTMKGLLDKKEYAEMQGAISEFEREIGLKLKNDILASLTGEVGFAMPFPDLAGGSRFSLGNGLMVFCGVKDSEKCAMAIERILSTAKLQQTVYKGVVIHHIPELSGPEGPVGYVFAGDMLVFSNFQRLQDLIDEEPPLMVSEEFAKISSQLPQQPGLVFYIDLMRLGKSLLSTNPQAQTEETLTKLQTLGSVGGLMIYDGGGLKLRSIGTSDKSWLETIGVLAGLLLIR